MYFCHLNHTNMIHFAVAIVHNGLLLWEEYCCHGTCTHALLVAIEYTVTMETILTYTLLPLCMKTVFCYEKGTVAMGTMPLLCLLLWKMNCYHVNHSYILLPCVMKKCVAMLRVLLPWELQPCFACCYGKVLVPRKHTALHTASMVHENSVLLCKGHCCHGNYGDTLLVAVVNVLLPWKQFWHAYFCHGSWKLCVAMKRVLLPWRLHPYFACYHGKCTVAMETELTYKLLPWFTIIVRCYAKSTVAMGTTFILCLLPWKKHCCHGNHTGIHTVAMVHENRVLVC